MFGLIALLLTFAITFGGYVQSRKFVRRRLRYVNAVHRGSTPFVAGAAATLATLPVVWLLPLIGGGTALLFGIAVAMGVAAGAKDIRRRLPERA